MRNRRNAEQGFHARVAGAGGALAFRLWTKATRRPVNSFAILAAVAASVIIVVNAVFLQSGSHPAPFFVNPKSSQTAANDTLRPVERTISERPVAGPVTPQPIVARRDDPIADLIAPSPRVAAVQRVLSDYGYGQIKPSGILDDATSSAIGKFEREHKLPVTGAVSDRLVRDLAGMVGHPLE